MDSQDAAGTQAERELIDILTRLIDPKLRLSGGEDDEQEP